ncbi:MAG: conjugal transfer protein TraH [Candidatus Babeliales bacterium]
MLRYVLLIISVCLCSASNASLEHELEKYFDSYAEINNVSGPNAYKGQSAGYYTGGSIYARTPPRIIHPVSMQLPNYSAGCGGIDLFTGGFSYINSDQLVNMMRNIGNNAQSLAFAIGLKTVMPMLANEVEQLNQWAQNINQFNINSCETAAMGLGMIWPQTEATQDVLCRANANQNGESSSYFDSRVHCSAKGNSSSKSNANNPITNLNMAWKAIKNSQIFGNDNEFAEFMMSLSGTIIFSRNENGNLSILDLPSLSTHSNLLQAIVYGGDATVYACDTYEKNGCLRPKLKPLKISSSKALGVKITQALNEMVYAMEHDEELKPSHKALLNTTSIPVYRILNVYTTYAPATKLMDIHYYSELIAFDLLYAFLVENIKAVEEISRSEHDLGKIGGDFFVKMQKAREQVDRERAKSAEQANQVLSLIEKAKNVEKEIASQYASGMKNSSNVIQR